MTPHTTPGVGLALHCAGPGPPRRRLSRALRYENVKTFGKYAMPMAGDVEGSTGNGDPIQLNALAVVGNHGDGGYLA